uniref:Uncharacterized protein n=1 Tax=Solanum lycopersicum TaxID=4081 RepID=K4AW74_SOLLC
MEAAASAATGSGLTKRRDVMTAWEYMLFTQVLVCWRVFA